MARGSHPLSQRGLRERSDPYLPGEAEASWAEAKFQSKGAECQGDACLVRPVQSGRGGRC